MVSWNLPLYQDLQALGSWLPEPCLPPPSRSLKLQSHWLPSCPGEHPTFRFTAACTQSCFFLVWTVSCFTLSFDSGLCSKSTSSSGKPSLITLSKPLSLLSFTLLCFYLDYAPYLQRGGLSTLPELSSSFAPYCYVATWVSVFLICKMGMTLPMSGTIGRIRFDT